jgi:hypothetical protein
LLKADKKTVVQFEIDDDGAYIYWPDLDLHLGWEQLFQIVDPEAARKAQQKSHQFNERYGAAIRRVEKKKAARLLKRQASAINNFDVSSAGCAG